MVTPINEQSPWASLRYDLPAGMVVFLVAIPLCLGIALASDAPLVGGLITGIVAGLLVSPLSGSALSVSGPAAGLAVIVAGGIAELGSYEAFLVAVMLAGVMQLVLGVLRAGILGSAFPLSVIKGMLAGIGVIIFLKQIPHALGRDADFEGDLNFIGLDGTSNTFTEIYAAVLSASPGVMLISAICLGILILWEMEPIRTKDWSRLLPGPLVAVVAGLVVNEVLRISAPSLAILDPQHLVSLPAIDGPVGFFDALPRPDLSAVTNPVVWRLAAVVAIIASIETLLSVEATDKLDPFRRISKPNRELFAQGVGNVVSGALGGIPMTAVIVRSSANVYAGGRTRKSGFFHGVLLLVAVVAFPFVLNRIPLGALAAVLLVVGYKLARISLFRSMWRAGLDQFLPFVVTVTATVLTDLLTGVLLGAAVGVLMVLLTNYQSAIQVISEGNAHLVLFMKDVSFLNKTRLRKILREVPNHSEVVIDGSRATFIDRDIYDVIEDFVESARYRDITVVRRNLSSKEFPLRLGKSQES
ncbi:MAG: SulP family inorganic anion transporter [Alphaproteobacteria bacterium]|nr:SulP family inorganic anion transporter [Alphaproteobacteria bacterium]